MSELTSFVEYVAKSLVDSPDDVSVTITQDGDANVIELSVAEADRGKILGEMFRCPATSVPVGRVSRDRGDAQEGEEPFEATIEVLVDAIEHCVKAGHQPRSVNRLLLRL